MKKLIGIVLISILGNAFADQNVNEFLEEQKLIKDAIIHTVQHEVQSYFHREFGNRVLNLYSQPIPNKNMKIGEYAKTLKNYLDALNNVLSANKEKICSEMSFYLANKYYFYKADIYVALNSSGHCESSYKQAFEFGVSQLFKNKQIMIPKLKIKKEISLAKNEKSKTIHNQAEISVMVLNNEDAEVKILHKNATYRIVNSDGRKLLLENGIKILFYDHHNNIRQFDNLSFTALEILLERSGLEIVY